MKNGAQRSFSTFIGVSVRCISQSGIPESKSKCNCNFERHSNFPSLEAELLPLLSSIPA